MAHRGEFQTCPLAPAIIATIHPAAILRAPDDESRRVAMRGFVADLKKIARRLAPASDR